MVHYKFYFGEEEKEILQKIVLSSRANVKRRRVASIVSAGMTLFCLAAAICFFGRGFYPGGSQCCCLLPSFLLYSLAVRSGFKRRFSKGR